jgi:hypothetical protein
MPITSRQLAPPIAALFRVIDPNGQARSYRVTGYYKRIEAPENMSWIERILWESEDGGEDHVMLIHCSRKEAEFVAGSGVSGTISRIEDIEVCGMVSWTKEQIEEAQKDYEQQLANPHMRFFEPLSLWKYWERDQAHG